MLKADFLQDAFHMSGNNEEAFEELLQEIDAHTCYHPVAMKNLVVFSRVEEAYQKNAPDECTVYAFWPGNPWVKGPGSKAPVIRFETVKVLPNVTSNKEYDAKLYAEMISSNSMMLSVEVDDVEISMYRQIFYHKNKFRTREMEQFITFASEEENR